MDVIGGSVRRMDTRRGKVMKINSCDECCYYEYERCSGYDCSHPNAPEEEDRGEEPLAENAEGDFPMWCPLSKEERYGI